MCLIVIEGSNGSGKTEIIKQMTSLYEITDRKSVPDWYRDAIIIARKCNWDVQKQIYLYGHDSAYKECDPEKDYIFDRFSYSTIIRINYGLGLSTQETVEEILQLYNVPNLIIVLRTDKDIIKERLYLRGDFSFDESFYDYENQVYEQLSNIFDIIHIVDNNESMDKLINNVSGIIELNTNVRKRVTNERRV